jgi:hypothetical protein
MRKYRGVPHQKGWLNFGTLWYQIDLISNCTHNKRINLL